MRAEINETFISSAGLSGDGPSGLHHMYGLPGGPVSTRAGNSTDARGDKRNVRHEFRPVGRRALRFASHATFTRRARVHTGRKWYRCAKCETRCLSRVPARRETGPPVCITRNIYPEGPCPHGPEVVPMRAEINETFIASSGPSGDGPSGLHHTQHFPGGPVSTRAGSGTDAQSARRDVCREFRPVGRRALRFASHVRFTRRARVHMGRK
jgi:hypothetical protein